MIGGWEPGADRENIEAECNNLTQRIPQVANSRKRGYAPRKCCGIAEMKVVARGLERVVHITKQFPEQNGNTIDGKQRWPPQSIAQSKENACER